MADINLTAGPITLTISLKHIVSHYPPSEINPALDTEISMEDLDGITDAIDLAVTIGGQALNVGIEVDSITITISNTGDWVDNVSVVSGSIDLTITISSAARVTRSYITTSSNNWIKWSKVGSLDFDIDLSNIAGQAPMDWSGNIYAIKMLGDIPVVYGVNGVSQLMPRDVMMGQRTIYNKGVTNKGAVAGNKSYHFFVDQFSHLIKLTEKGIQDLQFQEYLASMGTIILSLDDILELLYITDGTYGYILDIASEALGACAANLTGIGNKGGSRSVVSYGAISPTVFNVKTDIYDFGTRKMKAIDYLEVSTDISQDLYAALDYRRGYKDSFSTTPWFLVTESGIANCRCDGMEFRICLKATTYEAFAVDWIKIRGHIHNHSYLATLGGHSS